MNVLYLTLGVVLILAVAVDLIWTTLWVDGGGGPLSARLSEGVWHGLRKVARGRSRVLSIAGPLILVLSLGMWIGLLAAGWTLLFAGGEQALIDTRDGGPVSWSGRIWYVSYTMFTDGNGDFTPNGAIWQIASSLTTASGMLSATLAVSYILSVLGAVSEKRSFASTVTGLGQRPEELVQAGWEGESFRQLDLPLSTLSSELSSLADKHESYPILHYYHTEEEGDASSIAVALFDEALTLSRFGVAEEHWGNEALVKSARSSVEDYLQTRSRTSGAPAPETPPPPDLDRLRDADIPTVSDEEFAAALDDLEERRRKLLAAVEADAWHWPPLRED